LPNYFWSIGDFRHGEFAIKGISVITMGFPAYRPGEKSTAAVWPLRRPFSERVCVGAAQTREADSDWSRRLLK